MRIPLEGYRWICTNFPQPNEEEQSGFDAMICNLAQNNVKTILWPSKRGTFVFTWIEPRPA